MNVLINRAFFWYAPLYRFVAAKRLHNVDLDPRSIHALTVTVLSTSPLMWGYAFLAYYHISSPIPGIVGFICAFVHLSTPLFFRITKRHFIICNILLTAGIIHQMTFSYFTGGFMSTTLKWLPILPLLAGIMAGKKGAFTWCLISLFASFGFLLAELSGFVFPYEISQQGLFLATLLIQFGFTLVCTAVIAISVSLQNIAENILQEQRKKIDDLFKVLFHDLANPLGRIGIGLTIVKKQTQVDPQIQRGIEIMDHATESMLEITQNVRNLYALSKGKTEMDLVATPLNESIEYLQHLFADELKQKQLTLCYHFEKHAGIKLLVEPVSFKNQVLGNIISNAVKFSDPGSKIHIEAQPLHDALYAIEIRDEGMGIPQNLLKDIFDINAKTNRPGTMGEKGTGFGMQIMKSFVELYGGDVSIKSVEKKGTTFIIKLRGTT